MSEPNLIRNDTPHQVSMPEGTNVATGKKANASEPSVRKVLAGPDESGNEPVADEQRVLAPVVEATKSVDNQASFDRHLHEGHALAPTAVADTGKDTEAATDQRTENDRMALLPETLPDQSEVAMAPQDIQASQAEQGPLITHSENDHFVALPDSIPAAEAVAGPLIERSEQDRFVAVPGLVSETMARHSLPVADDESEEPVLAQAVDADADANAVELSETMLTMLQMDFPARVVKLKIENDKVRTKLDALQDSPRR